MKQNSPTGNSLTVGLVGMPASGKTEASRILAGSGVEIFSLSSIVLEELRSRRLEESHANYEEVARDLRRRFGREVVALRAVEQLRGRRPKKLCFDGIRNLSEVFLLRQRFSPFVILAMHSSPDVRFFRTVNYSRRGITRREDFDWKDRQNLKLGLGEVIALADFMIVHEHNSRARLKRDVLRIMDRVSRFIQNREG